MNKIINKIKDAAIAELLLSPSTIFNMFVLSSGLPPPPPFLKIFFYITLPSSVEPLMHALSNTVMTLSGDSPNQLYISDAAGVCQCVGVCGCLGNTLTYTLL